MALRMVYIQKTLFKWSILIILLQLLYDIACFWIGKVCTDYKIKWKINNFSVNSSERSLLNNGRNIIMSHY